MRGSRPSESRSSAPPSGTSPDAQADALEIETLAKRKLANEYDAAQERGEVSTGRDGPGAGVLDGNAKATVTDLGLTKQQVHEARQLRDVEAFAPSAVPTSIDVVVRPDVDDGVEVLGIPPENDPVAPVRVDDEVVLAALELPEVQARTTRIGLEFKDRLVRRFPPVGRKRLEPTSIAGLDGDPNGHAAKSSRYLFRSAGSSKVGPP